MSTIAVTGATGQLGRLAIAALKTRRPADTIVALARDPAKAADLGVPTRAFDYSKPDAAALQGVDVLVLISSNDFNDRVGQHKAVIAAAQSARVPRIVYTSILKGPASPLKLAADHIGTEQALAASGLSVTLLRNGWYTENFTGSLAGAIAAGAMIGANPAGKVSSAARADYAEAIAVAVGAEHAGKTYELAGDAAHTMPEMAAEVSRQTGKTIPYNALPEATYTGLLQSFGVPAVFAPILADADVQADKGALFDDSHVLSRLIGRPTTPMAATVAKALA
jgi:NAD(P)H dehydrogenase (quinone)